MSCNRCRCKVCSCIVNEQVKLSVNKIIQNPDEKGIINIKVPTKTSELINDSGFGQGSEGSSKIENIRVNSTIVPIVNKVAQIYVPTKVSDLENDSDYTTNATLTAHTSNKANPHNVTKSQIGLGNVDNTSDLNKPISTATQIELDKKVNSVNGINPDNNKNIKVGINEILKEYQPNIVADKNKKVLLFDEDGKTYYFNLGNIITNTSVDESLFVNVDNLLGVNTTSAITEKVINNFENPKILFRGEPFKGKISVEKIVEKMCHNPAKIFKIEKRGFIKEGYYADIAIVNAYLPWNVKKENILYKCGWSPFEGYNFKSRVTHTFVNGKLVYHNGKVKDLKVGKRLLFEREV